MAEVLDDSPFDGTVLLVHLILANHANEEGVCWPSTETIARQARVTGRRVQQIMAELESQGFITRSKREGRSNLVQVSGVKPASGVGVKPASGGDEAGFRGGVKPASPRTVSEPSRNLGASRDKDDIFEAVCAVCRLDIEKLTKDERGRVNAAAKQLRDVQAEPDEIRARAREYRRIFPNVPLTPQALTGNWQQIAPVKPNVVSERLPEFKMEAPATEEERAAGLEQIRKLAESLNASVV